MLITMRKLGTQGHPIEFNIWVLFRHMVDIILLNDFVSYSLFAFAWFRVPPGHSFFFHVLRWAVGLALIVFNLWVKVDAHRIVTDLAWYWADCFFVSLQSLVFDGVFEMAPHPMYSIGYAYALSFSTRSHQFDRALNTLTQWLLRSDTRRRVTDGVFRIAGCTRLPILLPRLV
jgi:hypothetical protein